MLEDTLEMEDDDELLEEADAEVDKVLFELTDGKLGLAGTAGTELPVSLVSDVWRQNTQQVVLVQAAETTLEDEEAERNMERYREQLNGLLST